MDPSVLWVSLALCVVSIWYISRIRAWNRSKRPPGPHLPVVGALFDMPRSFEYITFKDWSRQYGSDILYVEVLGLKMAIINSIDIANDLLDKRSAIYSSRLVFTMLGDLMGWGISLPTLPYGEAWRTRRRLFHQEFNDKAAMRYYPQQYKAAHHALRCLLDNPEKWEAHLRHEAGMLIMDIAYGIDVLPVGDPYIDTAEKALASVSIATMPGAFLVDLIPALKYVPSWLPGAGFKRKAKVWKALTMTMLHAPFNALKENVSRGTAKPSFGSRSLQNMNPTINIDEQEELVRNVAMDMYMAGADTTVSSMMTFVSAMVKYPDVLSQVQKELDSVLGRYHLPTFDDQESLPYLMATVKECLRWKNVAPIGVPHFLTEDDEYKGYHIPGGTVITANVWAMMHDENIYPDPFTFNPGRFLKDGKLDPAILQPESVVFGFGRRICPGQHIARATLWLVAGCIAAVFNITKATDENGNVIEPSDDVTPGSISFPVSFKCKITPRSEEAETVIRATEHH